MAIGNTDDSAPRHPQREAAARRLAEQHGHTDWDALGPGPRLAYRRAATEIERARQAAQRQEEA